MNSHARTCDATKKPIIWSLARPFSNFDFIDKHLGLCPSFRRIMSQVRQHNGQTMVVECIRTADDLQQENDDIQTCIPNFDPFRNSKTYRLSFFSKAFNSRCKLNRVHPDDFIGYMIIKKDKIGQGLKVRVYESVIRPSQHINNFIHHSPKWLCSVYGNKLPINGYLYAQQNTITNCCAHVAIRTAVASYHQEHDMSYREMNTILKLDLKNDPLIKRGLKINEIIQIIESTKAKCFSYDYTTKALDPKKLPFQKCIYGSIESGFPAIVLFDTNKPGEGHAIPLFGHTFSDDTWVHRAEHGYFKPSQQITYIPSESWVSMYIGHDDNYGSNFCIPRKYMHSRKHCSHSKTGLCIEDIGCVAHVISTYPETIKIDAIQAEVAGYSFLFDILLKRLSSKGPLKFPDLGIPWSQRLYSYFRSNQLVFRPILITGKQYLKHLEKIRDWDKNKIKLELLKGKKTLKTDEWLWMIELSVPELFSTNRRKLGEVLVKAEMPFHLPLNFDTFLLARIPGYFVTINLPSNELEYWECGVKGHVELYRCEES